MSHLGEVETVVRVLFDEGENPILVVSAFEGVTDELIKAMDVLHEKDYSGADIDEAFHPAQEIMLAVINECFTFETDTAKTAAVVFVNDSFAEVSRRLMLRKETTRKLKPGEDTYEIRNMVTGAGERIAAGVLKYFLEEKGVGAHVVVDVKSAPSNGTSNKRALHRAIQEGIATQAKGLGAEALGKVLIFGGHVEGTPRGITVDVGRGYSDTTAVDTAVAAISARLGITESVTFWKREIPGLLSADPSDLNLPPKNGAKDSSALTGVKPVYNRPQLVTDVSFGEALELASAGSKLLQTQSLLLAQRHDIRLRVRDIMRPRDTGTSYAHTEITTAAPFKAIQSQKCDLVTFRCPDMIDQSGFEEKLSAAFTKEGISISDPLSSGAALGYSIALPKGVSDRDHLREKLRSICRECSEIVIDGETYGMKIEWAQEVANISVIGAELANKPGILAEITGVFAAYNISVEGATQEPAQRKISFYVQENARREAVSALHAYFIDRDPVVREHVARRRAEISARYK